MFGVIIDWRGCNGVWRGGIILVDLRFGYICIGWFGVGCIILDGLDRFGVIMCFICWLDRYWLFKMGYWKNNIRNCNKKLWC